MMHATPYVSAKLSGITSALRSLDSTLKSRLVLGGAASSASADADDDQDDEPLTEAL